MKEFAQRITDQRVEKGSIAIWFLGQAGFIIKDCGGHIIGYDLYMSDSCEREFGFKRMLAKLLSPQDLHYTAYICSHGHYDHLDIDSIPMVSADAFYTTRDGMDELEKIGVGSGRLIACGDSLQLTDELRVKFVFCDHGALAPFAVGAVFSAGEKRVYFAGDTCYRPDVLVNDDTYGCDVAVLPINGAFGNLNEAEAADVARLLNAGLTIPCHFWNFAEHGGDPMKFIDAAKSAGLEYRLMAQGDMLIVK